MITITGFMTIIVFSVLVISCLAFLEFLVNIILYFFKPKPKAKKTNVICPCGCGRVLIDHELFAGSCIRSQRKKKELKNIKP